MVDNDFDQDDIVRIPIDGTLDLHNFSPKDLKTLIPDYLDECLAENIYEVKIIHGKGIGNIRRSVHALLERHPKVVSYSLANLENGSWGATIAVLQK